MENQNVRIDSMADNKIALKTIRSLNGMRFYIPSYQRGYRWTNLQIENLLKDVFEFKKDTDGSFYCLQPLVVREDKERKIWRVIDGQQRLTTLYLILKSLNSDTFFLEYERDSYIEKCDNSNSVQNDNIEIYYLTTAKQIIDNWNPRNKEGFVDKILDQTKFIFYNVGDISDEEEHDIFNNLNSGKIALTNAELIKALFLTKVGREDLKHREVEQRLLADEFDQIERTLRQDDFWYFLAGNNPKPSSCINLLFNLMLDSDEKLKKEYRKDEPLRTFFYFNDLILGEKGNDSYIKSKTIWEKVREVFHIMEGWYNDPSMYNLIGYHRGSKNGKTLQSIYNEFRKSNSKTLFKNWLKRQCECCVDYPDGYMKLRFDTDKDRVFNLLLLFNIATLNERPDNEAVKFSFANFHKYNWDVEHISPQNPKENESLRKVIMSVNNYKDIPGFNELIQAIDDNNETKIKELRLRFFAEGEELMGIQNLTLLTEHDNRGIGNRFFFEKRQKLQEYYKKGSFMPACSMNVFMKFYSNNPQQMLFWDENDRKNYKTKIQEVINNFFNKLK